MWKELLPEDESIDGYFCQMKLEGLNRPEEIREFLKDIKEKLLQGKIRKTGKLKNRKYGLPGYMRIRGRKAWIFRKLAKLGTELLYTEDMQKLEELLSQAPGAGEKEECKPAASLIAGDILYKQGKNTGGLFLLQKGTEKRRS